MVVLNNKTKQKANSEIIDLYWNEIKDNKPLSRADEGLLFARMREGDRLAYDQLIQANLRFVVRVAREYCPEDGTLLMDLIAEGNMGLLRAVESFDETRGFKFITYAVWWIRQAIRKAVPQSKRVAKLPMSHVNDMHVVEKETAVLSQQLRRLPTLSEVAEVVDMSPERLLNAMEAGHQDLSLDGPVFEDGEQPLYAAFPVEDPGFDKLEQEAVMQSLTEGLAKLDEREERIIKDYFGLVNSSTMTLEEIGEEMGVTRERVRQLRNRALAKMRSHFAEWQIELSAN